MKTKKISILKNEKLMILLSFAFFVFMMVFHLTHSALWADEWTEYVYSQKSILTGDLYNSIICTFQPPLYNFLMHFWLKLGTSVLWFRIFNVVLGCLSYLFMYIALKELFNRKVAIVVPCILAVCYQWIYCIQECSEYALMLCCLFGTLMFYIKCFKKFSYFRMVGFIICSVMAIYSQYGSVFVALPLLALFFFGNICDKEVGKSRKVVIFLSYIISLVVFAAPLYFKFLKIQMENNGISSNAVEFTATLLIDLPFTFGQIIAYLFNINSGDFWPLVLGILGFISMIWSIYILKNNEMAWVKKSLIICLWIGYITHFLLVQLHIYGMVHPNKSAGFFQRYSYFYLPIVFVTIPIMMEEIMKVTKGTKVTNSLLKYVTLALAGMVIVVSAISTLKNWNKSLDDQFAEIWIENEGWEVVTYLYGKASPGFNYYVSHSDSYEEGYLDNVTTTVDYENLPNEFWAWRTNWGGNGWQTTIDKARENGYTVIIYNDSGYVGQLAYCYIE